MEADRKEVYMTIDLMRLAGAMWHYAWAVVLSMVLFGGLGFAVAAFAVTPQYKANALMYVNNSALSVGGTSISLSDLTASQNLVDTYTIILKSRRTLEQVIREADLPYTYAELNARVEAGAVNNTEIFEITYTSSDPEEAERVVNTIVEVLPGQIGEIIDGSSARPVDFAVVPAKKDSPDEKKYTAVGLTFGLLFSCFIICMREILDEQIYSEDDLTRRYHMPILAAIPELLTPENGGRYSGSYYRRERGESRREKKNIQK